MAPIASGVLRSSDNASSTAYGTEDGKARDYRYGYGILDENLNMQADAGEKRVYFEVSNFSTYVFFENPH